MKGTIKQYWLLMLVLILANSACRHQNSGAVTTDSTVTTSTTVVKRSGMQNNGAGTVMKEDFEQGSKSTYAAGSATFKSGDWYLADALVGTQQEDIKNGDKSIRIRNKGKLAMQFEVDGATHVTISYAAYGKDGPSSWQLWVSTNGGNSYEQIDSTITVTSHTLKQATFTTEVEGSIRLEIRKVSGGKNRINIDDIIIGSGQGMSVQNTGPPVPGDDGNLLLGNLSNAGTSNPNNYLLNRRYYISSYNRDKGEPNWVCWHINANDLGNADRMNDFRPDTDLPASWFEVMPDDYKGSGFDKGHNCPSGDRTSNQTANSSTFLMDNMIPQAPNNNQHTWEHFESYCRNEVRAKGNEVYIIMGSYGSGGTGRNGYAATIARGKINVPAHIWKVAIIIPDGNNDLARINSSAEVIAINTPNDNGLSQNWMEYVCTVRDIERATGYNLLSALPKAVQDALETQRFGGGI